MSKVGDLAVNYYAQGYNCCESVWLAFAEDLTAEERDLGLQLAGGFGGGLGAGGDCGALCGGVMVLGRFYGRKLGEPRQEELPKLTKALYEYLTTEYGHSDCRNLKPSGDHKPTCSGYVRAMAEMTEKLLDEGLDSGDCG